MSRNLIVLALTAALLIAPTAAHAEGFLNSVNQLVPGAVVEFAGVNNIASPVGYQGSALRVVDQPYTLTPRGCGQITSLSAAVHLTPPTGAILAVISVEGQPVRWRDDGTAPTAAVGILTPVVTSAPMTYGGSLSAIQFIQTAASATIDVCYYQ